MAWKIKGVVVLYVNNSGSPSFKAANVNILALSDRHGQIRGCSKFFDAFSKHRGDIFALTENQTQKASNLNIFAIIGDWFMNPGTRGVYRTNPDKSSGFLQNIFLKKLVNTMSGFASTLLVPGNHCLGDGDTEFYDLVKDDNLINMATNIDLSGSKAFQEMPTGKFVNYKVIEVPDDKNPSIIRKMLVLGLIPPNMAYYSPEAMENTTMPDNNFKKSSNIGPKDIENTITCVENIVSAFKSENPNSPVTVLNHSDLNVIKMICDRVNIDYILQGHVHKTDNETYTNPSGKETKIFNLSENFKHFGSLKIHFDDEGSFDDKFQLFSTETDKKTNNEFDELYQELFSEDSKPLIQIEGQGEQLSISNIRYSDNPISKFTTDGILEALQEIYPDIKIFMIGTSTFRKDLVAGEYLTNIDIVDLFAGINESYGKVKVGELTGAELVRYIAQNIFENIKSPQRNTIVAVSGIQFDRKKTGEFFTRLNITDLSQLSDEDLEPLTAHIRVLNDEGVYEPIKLNSHYKTACPVKILKKADVPQIKKAGESFEQTDKTVLRLFLDYVDKMNKSNRLIEIPQDKRIIDE